MAIFYYPQDNINTDIMFPGKYTYTAKTEEEIVKHLFEDLDPEFSKKAQPGDIIMAGKNFGCGSSREQPSIGLKHLGIKAVIAKSFSRIFFRSATNQGLLLIECPEAVDAYEEGKEVKIDEEKGEIYVGDEKFSFPPLPLEMKKILKAGGLLSYIKSQLDNAL